MMSKDSCSKGAVFERVTLLPGAWQQIYLLRQEPSQSLSHCHAEPTKPTIDRYIISHNVYYVHYSIARSRLHQSRP